ncbi:MAG TPA: hypothetical protein VK672_05930 [Solirubrobacteraceae bacterium]|nr:hypothetical protein [Solirubrobacteraceae bacterium]
MVVGWALGLACFVYLLTLPPTLGSADESYLLYGAKRVLQGQALYRDFFDFVTPGSFYLYALAYAVGGVSITTARVTTALLNALSATCTYFLTRHVASMAEAVVTGLLVVVICVPVWNMASNHWMATSLGLGTTAVLLAPRWADSTAFRPGAAGALAGFVVCSNQSHGVWLIVWLVITVPMLALAREGSDRRRRCLCELVWTAVGGAAVCVAVLGYAVWRSSLAEMLYATHTWVVTNYRNYNVGKMSWSGYGLAWADGVYYTYLWLFECIPVILGIEAVSLFWGIWRHGLRSHLERTVLLLLAVSAVASIRYYPDVIHVAFVAPFSFVVIAGMIHRVRTAFAFMQAPAAKIVMRLVLVGVLAIVLLKGWSNASRAWRDNPTLYQTAFGTLASLEGKEATLRDLRERLEMNTGPPPRLFAYQSDAWIYLTLPADNPTPFALLRPVYNSPGQIQEAIDWLERDPQARVVVNLLAPEPGDPFMGYLNGHFQDVAGVGPRIVRGGPVYRIFERKVHR